MTREQKYARFLELYPSSASQQNQRFHMLVRLLLNLPDAVANRIESASRAASRVESHGKPVVVVKRRRNG